MIRLVNLLAVIALIAAASIAYRVNAQAREALRIEAELTAELTERRATMAVLRAEWAHLNSPAALLRLAGPYAEILQLGPRTPQQLGHPRYLPFKREIEARVRARAAAAAMEDQQ